MKYKITQVREEGFVKCKRPFGEVETDNLETEMNSFAEWLGETATYSAKDNTVEDDFGNKFVFKEIKK